MSFGCSPSDVLKLLEMSTRVYLAFKDANENSETQVAGLVKEFKTFHICLEQLSELMKQHGQPMPFMYKDFEATLNRCLETLGPYVDYLVDKKPSVKKIFYTIRYIGMEKEIDGLRKQITGHYQALHMWLSFLQVRLHLESNQQTQLPQDTAPTSTADIRSRTQSTTALDHSPQRPTLALPAPHEHPLHREWRIFDRWLQQEDERITHGGAPARPSSLGEPHALALSGDVQMTHILYQFRQMVNSAIVVEENREKRATRAHLAPSDATRYEVWNMQPTPQRAYTLDSDFSGSLSNFDWDNMSSSTATIRPGPSTPSPPIGSPGRESYLGPFPFEVPSPSSASTSRAPSISTIGTNRSSFAYSPNSRPSFSAPEMSTAGTTPEISNDLGQRASPYSIPPIAIGDAAFNWKRICRHVKVERTDTGHKEESRICELLWRYREDTGISMRARYKSSKDGKTTTWIEQHFPASGPSRPQSTTYDDGALSIDFPQTSFGKLSKGYTDINYTFTDHDAAQKLQTLLYTNNGEDPAELLYDKPVLTIASNLNPTECRGRNLRLWKKQETWLENDESVTSDVLILLFYTDAIKERKHWVEEPHYAFEWLDPSVYKSKNDGDKLVLSFSKDHKRWRGDKSFQRRSSSNASHIEQPRSPSIRNDSMEATRPGSVLSNAGAGRGVNAYGYKKLIIEFQSKKDRRAFLEVWKEGVKPLSG